MKVPSNKTLTKGALTGGTGLLAAAIIYSVFSVEGGYVNDPRDPGGETNHGITRAVAVNHGFTGSMKDLPKSFAKEIYYESYIVKPGYLPLVQIQPAVAHKLIDAGVNVGPGRSSRWFQQSLNTLSRGGRDYPMILVDGDIGPNTLKTYARLEEVRGRTKACELVLKLLDAHQAQHYMNLTNLSQYVVGWVDHRVGNIELARCQHYLSPDIALNRE